MKTYLSKQNRVLLAELVRTDFKLRYQGSILGYAWSLLKPLLLFIILYIVFVYFLKLGKGIPHYPVYLLLGIVLWNFFVEMTSQSLGSIVGRGDLIRKIRIPRWIIVFSSSLSALINLTLNLIVVMIFAIVNGVHFSFTSLLLPVNIIEIYVFALGVSLFLAAAYVKFRDISYIWEVVLQAGFYATPIIYPIALINSVLIQKILLFSPMGQSIQDARYNLVTHQAVTAHSLIGYRWEFFVPYVVTLLIIVGGVLYFKKQARTFAENI